MPGPLAGITYLIVSFLLGAVPFGYLVGKAASGVDLRTVGSGGTGATNVLRTLGPRHSGLVFVLDFAKGGIPVLAGRALGFTPEWIVLAAVASVAGHCWSPFIGFKGGKGVAAGGGAAIALFPPLVLVFPVLAIVVWITKYVSLGSLVATGLATVLAAGLALSGRLEPSSAFAIGAIAVIIFIRHHDNIRRLASGTERRIGEKVALS